MAGCDEDLEFNPFYQALQSRFYSLYERAQQNCWLVCIPVATALDPSQVTQALVETNLLEPSGFLRDVYQSSGPQRLEWRLSQNRLVCTSRVTRSFSVRVLSEELAYNKALKQFKIFIVDRPLDPSHQMPTSAEEGSPDSTSGRVRGGSPSPSITRELLKRRRTYDEHRAFLESFAKYREGLEELNHRIRQFHRNYLVVKVESLLLDTATKLGGVVKQGYAAFMEANRQDSKLQDKRICEACWTSIEGYLMHHVHSKIFPAIRDVHARQDQEFRERCQRLRRKLTPSLLEVPDDYDCPYPITTEHLVSMAVVDTPLEMLYAVQDAMESVMVDVQRHFDVSFRIGNPQPLASDGLIALMASILVKVDIDCMLSMLYYMENFHWSQSDADQLSFILVTMRAAVEFLRGPDVQQWLPQSEPTNNKLARISPVSSPRSSDDSDCHVSSLSLSLSTTTPSLTSEDSFTSGGNRIVSGRGLWSGGGGGGNEVDERSRNDGGERGSRQQPQRPGKERDGGVSDSSSSSLMPGSTLLQALGARLGVSEEAIRSHQKQKGDPGPFLSRLMENDRIVTSSDYDFS